MSVIRNDLTKGFAMIANQIITDIRVSIGARLLFCYLSSKPGNWQFWNNDMAKQLGIKDKNTISKYLKELIETKWIERKRNINNEGKFTGGYEYVLKNPFLQENHFPEKPIYGENKEHSNIDLVNNIDLVTNTYIQSTNKKDDFLLDIEFEKFWSKYPRQIDKQRAKKTFISLIKNKKVTLEDILVGVDKYLAYIKQDKVEERYIKHPTSWLNAGGWENEYNVLPAKPQKKSKLYLSPEEFEVEQQKQIERLKELGAWVE